MEGKQDSSKMKEEVFVIKPLTHKQLAQMYGVSWITFQNWIKKGRRGGWKKDRSFLSCAL